MLVRINYLKDNVICSTRWTSTLGDAKQDFYAIQTKYPRRTAFIAEEYKKPSGYKFVVHYNYDDHIFTTLEEVFKFLNEINFTENNMQHITIFKFGIPTENG